MLSTRSGFPMPHPSTNFGAGGKSFAAPSIAPPSTQVVIVSISVWVRRWSFWNWPCCGSACQGGIIRLATFSRMDLAHGRTSLKLSAEKGAFSPGRWHSAQLLKKIGATSLLKVIFFAADLVSLARLAGSAQNAAAKSDIAIMIMRVCFMAFPILARPANASGRVGFTFPGVLSTDHMASFFRLHGG